MYIGNQKEGGPPLIDMEEGGIFNLFQVEAAIALGIGMRVGINFAEIADFVPGFFQVDILKDDQKAVNARETESQRQLKTLERLRNASIPEATFLKPAVDITDENPL